MSKWSLVAVLVLLVLTSAMGLNALTTQTTLANTTGPVPPSPWLAANTTGPVPPSPWANTTGPVPPSPWG
jgi:hypothetical protein